MKKRRAQIREVSPSPSPSTAALLKLKLIANAITYDLLVGRVHVFQTSNFSKITIVTRTFKMVLEEQERKYLQGPIIKYVRAGGGGENCGHLLL